MRSGGSFDVLVIGSGASGLAAAVSAERAGVRVGLATKTTLQACNSAKAQGGIQAAVGSDDSPELHAEDVWKSSHETADRRLVEVLTSEGPGAIAWLEEHLSRTIPAKAPQVAEDFRRGPLVGTPEQVVEKLRELEALGMTYAITYFAEAAYDRSGIELFEREVIPALR